MEIFLKEDVLAETEIWRYMDLTKFLDLILNENLYMRRIDKFDDTYEGFISDIYKKEVSKKYQSIGEILEKPEEEMSNLSLHHVNALESLPQYAYASCWYTDSVESAAMWKLYGKNDNCIAIRTTVSNLKNTFLSSSDDGTLYLQAVRYVNEDSLCDSDNYLKPMFEKRSSFEYEKEFRALYLLNKGRTLLSPVYSGLSLDKHDSKNPDGLTLQIDVRKLISSVYISPTASPNFKSIVEKILTLAGFEDISCIQSELYKTK